MKKLIIFDLDGTLIDTLEDLKNAVNHALLTKNYPIKSKEQVRKAIGNGVSKLIERSLPTGVSQEEYQSTLEIFKIHYSNHYMDYSKPYDGITNLLTLLKNDGYLLAVATNKLQEIAEKLINKYFPNLFDVIAGDQIGRKKKPASDMVDHILQTLNIKQEDALYIGDTEIDKQTAVNSHIDYLLESYGYRTKQEWEQLNPKEKVFSSPNDLYIEIKKHC